MEWWVSAVSIIGIMLIGLSIGLPVAIAFFVANFFGLLIFVGGVGFFHLLPQIGLAQLMSYYLAPIFLFIILGETMFRSGLGDDVIDAVDAWLGRLPGRLSVLAIGAGTLLGALIGSTLASAAVLSSSLAPLMKKRGYSTGMCIGPILVGSMLAVLIPPSTFAVLMGSIARVSIGTLLIAILGPGLLLAFVSVVLVIVLAAIKPSIAPPYTVKIERRQKLFRTIKAFPLILIIFAVTGAMFLGIATPTECAGVGAFLCLVIAAAFGRLNFQLIKEIFLNATKVSAMVMLIVMSAAVFSSILAYTGATKGVTMLVAGTQLPPMLLVVLMLLIVVFLGTFAEITSIMMVCVPIFQPVVQALGIDPMWFWTLMIVSLAIGSISPPFGLLLFTIRAYMPESSMADIYRIAIPWVFISVCVVAICTVFPPIITWLPSLMR